MCHYLDARCLDKIISVVEKQMIESHMHRLVHMENSGLVNMLGNDKYDDLGRICKLFFRVPSGLSIMRDVMTSYIQDTGKQLFTNPERLKDPINLVQRPLDLKDKYDKIINLAFYNKTFQNALNSTFEYCREFTQNSQLVRNKKIEKTVAKKNNYTHKTIFT